MDKDTDASAKVFLANTIRALHSVDYAKYRHWRTQLLSLKERTVGRYVGDLLNVAWGRAMLHHIWVFSQALPLQEIPGAQPENALTALESLSRYSRLPIVAGIPIPLDSDVPPFPYTPDGARHRDGGSATWEAVGISATLNSLLQPDQESFYDKNLRGLLALGQTSPERAAMSLGFVVVFSVGGRTPEALDLGWTEIATLLALVSNIDRRAPWARRGCELAVRFATWANPHDFSFGELVSAFKTAGLKVPGFAPPAAATRRIFLCVDGSTHDGSANPGQQPSSSTPSGPAAPGVGASDAPSERQILRNLEMTLSGLVGIEDLKRLIAMDLCDFLITGQSRGRVFWGDPGVGKTELAQRIAGLRDGFPPLNIGSGQICYVSGVDGRIEIKQAVDDLPPMSILLIDEADKCLDSAAGMVSPSDAMQVRHAIVTHFQRRPIYWVFLGVFAHARGRGPLADDAMSKIFGEELASRLDFVDWQFPSWTRESLLQAVSGSANHRKLDYADEAVAMLVEYCASMGGGVRTFDNIEAAIVRTLRMKGGDLAKPVGPGVVHDVLARRAGRPQLGGQ